MTTKSTDFPLIGEKVSKELLKEQIIFWKLEGMKDFTRSKNVSIENCIIFQID